MTFDKTSNTIFQNFAKTKCTLTPDYQKLPITNWIWTEENWINFNKVYQHIHKWRKMSTTKSGNISKKCFYFPCCNVRIFSNLVELVICSKEGFFRLQQQLPK